MNVDQPFSLYYADANVVVPDPTGSSIPQQSHVAPVINVITRASFPSTFSATTSETTQPTRWHVLSVG